MKRRTPYDNELIGCARKGCENTFKKRVHNQKYCSKTCCQISTNEKLLKRYHDGKKPIKKGRICKKRGCTTILSVYNREITCASCQDKDYLTKLKKKK